MSVAKHLEESVNRLCVASARIDAARDEPLSLDSLRNWLEALTDYASALSDIHSFNNESVHEKLHELGERVGLKSLTGEHARFRPD